MGNDNNKKGVLAANAMKGVGGFVNVKSMLKMEHLQNVAVWAAGEGNMLSLGAVLGHRLASFGESIGIPVDQSLVTCQRCESILQPGYNCTIRIENNRAKGCRRRKKSSKLTQNSVVYTCHFCAQRNLKRGTQKGYLKDVYKSKHPKPVSESKPTYSKNLNSAGSGRLTKTVEGIPIAEAIPKVEDISATPAPLLLDRPKRKRKGPGSNSNADVNSQSTTVEAMNSGSASSRKRRKPCSSLKKIVENKKNQSNVTIAKLAIPFQL